VLEEFYATGLKKSALIIKGYAGTGKTTLISAFINYLNHQEKSIVLMAPTGRAAKVISSYSGMEANTIHKSIYFQTTVDGQMQFKLQQNKLQNAFFIVDEASMIGSFGGIGGSFISKGDSLLDDIVKFVYSGINCKLVFVGDVAQLPPVGSNESDALKKDYLDYKYKIFCDEVNLTDITRQSLNSGILSNATLVRNIIDSKEAVFPVLSDDFEDIKFLSGFEIEEELQNSYTEVGINQTVILCRSNKQANRLNQYIRYQVLFREDELSAGDLLMVVRNNYHWLKDFTDLDFIANGQMVEVLKVSGYEEKYGFKFANVTIALSDNAQHDIDLKVLLTTIYSESPALTKEEGRSLYEQVWEEYSYIPNKKERMTELKKDPYFNALQVKFGYAITCHKSQGGQWDHVFLDQGYFVDDMLDISYLRWYYTAITRAKQKLYFINPNPKFIPDQNEE
jgi:exodeoxyribonuclease-5